MRALTLRTIPPEQTRELRRSVLRRGEPLAAMAAHEPPQALAVGAFRGEELVAVGLIGREGPVGEWRIRGMATAPAVRHRGIGGAVLAALLELAGARGGERVWCNARAPARSLYERAGFRVISDEFEIEDIGPHFVMERPLHP